ncbi:MAG: YihY/virulence factor BrkB family protein [Acetobacteraceae bacterium]|nr:YihY/virulence factor BrkB family protein [Acetobacteraceae bacterium]
MPNDQSTRRSGRDSRGREAERPQDIPPRGWKDILSRVWQEISDNSIFLVAGGVTYAVLLALFPALAALVSIYGLVLDPGQIEQQVNTLSGVLPDETKKMIADELHQLASASNGALGIGAVIALLFALWSASRGMSGMINALDIAYEQKETRSFFKYNLIALLLTLGMIVGGLVVIALVAVLPAAVQFIGFSKTTKWLLLLLEWPLLIAVVIIGLAALYRYAPDRREAKWRWITPGSIAATVLWLIGSLAFTVYVSNFASYNKTYGSLGGVVVMLTWLYLSAFVVLFGAVINAQAERQTRRDSTVDGDKPLGKRGAYAADTVGPSTEDQKSDRK